MNVYEAYEAMGMEDRLQLVLETIQSAPRTAALRIKNIESLQRFLFSISFQLLCSYSNKSEISLLFFWVGLVVLVLSFVPPVVLLCLFVCLLGQFFGCLELFVHAGCFFVF